MLLNDAERQHTNPFCLGECRDEICCCQLFPFDGQRFCRKQRTREDQRYGEQATKQVVTPA